MNSLCFSLLLLLASLAPVADATVITVNYVEGKDDPTPVEPLPDNPGTTLGEQRRFVHDYVVKLTERVVWMPNDKPIPSDVNWGIKRNDEFIACASPVFSRPELDPELGVRTNPLVWLRALHGERPAPIHGSFFQVDYSSSERFSMSLTPDLDGPPSLVATGLHEHVHLLGFASSDPTGDGFINSTGKRYSDFDLHLRLAGDDTPVHKMNDEMLQSLVSTEGAARWLGDATAAAAPQLLTAGHEGGQVFLDTSLSHLSFAVEPHSLMYSAGGSTLELGIAAYMLSDIGWGPVVDSEVVRLAASRDSATSTTVTVDAMVRARVEDTSATRVTNIVVNATLPNGLRADNVLGAPAACPAEIAAGEGACRYATDFSAGSIQYTLTGEPGIYEVEVDVDHQDNHVDPRPVNNFATVQITVGVNTIEAVTLSKSSVAESQPRDTLVGMLGVDSAAGATVTHTFELASGTGGRHNACFRVDGERLLTAKPFDREGLANLNLRVLAKASNGFSREQDFTVEVTAAGSSASAWTWSTAAYADAGASVLSLRSFALAALLLMVASCALVGGSKRKAGSRLALALAVLLLTASCGGGGGGSSAPAPPPRPAFTC